MPSEVILPRVDMDMATGKIAKWLVEPGASVSKGQPLFEIETDKATMEIEAEATGTIRDLTAAGATDIPVGSTVAWIFAEGEAPVASFKLATTAEKDKGERARVSVEDHRFDSAPPSPLHDTAAADHRLDAVPGAERPRATPMARRLASERGVDLATLKGSGPRGRIQAADIAPRGPAPTLVVAVPGPRTVAPTTSMPVETTFVGTMGAAARADLATPPSPALSTRPGRPRTEGSLNIVQLREGEGRPLLLIHGFGADVNNWRPLLQGTASSRPVLALDLPGHGGTPLGAVTDFEALVDTVEAGLGPSGLGAVDLVGHSLGGAVAASLAARGSLDLRSLLLISPAGLGPDINGGFVRGFLRATSEAALTPWMHQLVADPAAITPAFVRATLKARESTDLVASQTQVADAVFPDDTQSFSIRADLARIAVPTRVLFGTADAIIPARHATGLPGHVALHLLPGVGHMPHVEAKDVIARILAQIAPMI